MTNQIPLYTTKQAANYLGVSPSFLEKDRWAGSRVPYIKIGTRTVRYRLKDLDAFIATRTLFSTSEEIKEMAGHE